MCMFYIVLLKAVFFLTIMYALTDLGRKELSSDNITGNITLLDVLYYVLLHVRVYYFMA